jgi:hypothetical protein
VKSEALGRVVLVNTHRLTVPLLILIGSLDYNLGRTLHAAQIASLASAANDS